MSRFWPRSMRFIFVFRTATRKIIGRCARRAVPCSKTRGVIATRIDVQGATGRPSKGLEDRPDRGRAGQDHPRGFVPDRAARPLSPRPASAASEHDDDARMIRGRRQRGTRAVAVPAGKVEARKDRSISLRLATKLRSQVPAETAHRFAAVPAARRRLLHAVPASNMLAHLRSALRPRRSLRRPGGIDRRRAARRAQPALLSTEGTSRLRAGAVVRRVALRKRRTCQQRADQDGDGGYFHRVSLLDGCEPRSDRRAGKSLERSCALGEPRRCLRHAPYRAR